MPDQNADRREFAASMLPVFEQLPQDQRLALMRGGIVASAGEELADILRTEIAEAESAIAGVRNSQVLSGLLGGALAAATGERLTSLKAVLADVTTVQAELRAQPTAPAATTTLTATCPRCGNASAGGLCTGCQSHDRFVEDDRQAYERDLADRDHQRVQDDYVRDQQSYFDIQDNWRDD